MGRCGALMSELSNVLLQSAVESTVSRIRRDASGLHDVVSTVAELRKVNPASTPSADLRLSARELRMTAIILEQLAEAGQ